MFANKILIKCIVISFISIMTNTLYAQLQEEPDYLDFFSDVWDTTQVCKAHDKKIYRKVCEIDAMPLRIDSIFVNEVTIYNPNGNPHKYIGKRLFFDSKNRLRKYTTCYHIGDGASDYKNLRAYYDEDGELIYLDYETGCNCYDVDVYYVLNKGIVTEHDGNYYCGCCEDEDSVTYPKKLKYQEIGKPMKYDVDRYNLSSFSDAKTLLRIMDIYKYPYSMEVSEFCTKEQNWAFITDQKEKKGVFRNDTISLSYTVRRNDTVIRKDCNVIKTCDNNHNIHKCYIEMYAVSKNEVIESEQIKTYYDANGHLYLIEYFYTEGEEFSFCINNGVIKDIPLLFGIWGNTIIKSMGGEAYEKLKRSFIGKKLKEIQCKKRSFGDFVTTKQLENIIEQLKKTYK